MTRKGGSSDMLQTIRRFVIDNYLFGEEGKLADEDSFMETGIIDSTGILELVRFLESTYGIKLTDEELIPDNLDSVNKIVSFIQAKQSVLTHTDGRASFQSVGGARV
jgi:acyl carrier protein